MLEFFIEDLFVLYNIFLFLLNDLQFYDVLRTEPEFSKVEEVESWSR